MTKVAPAKFSSELVTIMKPALEMAVQRLTNPTEHAEKRAPRSVPKKRRTVHKEARCRSADARPKAKATKPATKVSRASRALELAVQAVEIMADVSAPAEELFERMRWLTEGPAEFRGYRLDLPKTTLK